MRTGRMSMILKRKPEEKAGGDCPSTHCSLPLSVIDLLITCTSLSATEAKRLTRSEAKDAIAAIRERIENAECDLGENAIAMASADEKTPPKETTL
jgi:L-aminopeptidase/D-esterase-like protein